MRIPNQPRRSTATLRRSALTTMSTGFDAITSRSSSSSCTPTRTGWRRETQRFSTARTAFQVRAGPVNPPVSVGIEPRPAVSDRRRERRRVGRIFDAIGAPPYSDGATVHGEPGLHQGAGPGGRGALPFLPAETDRHGESTVMPGLGGRRTSRSPRRGNTWRSCLVNCPSRSTSTYNTGRCHRRSTKSPDRPPVGVGQNSWHDHTVPCAPLMSTS